MVQTKKDGIPAVPEKIIKLHKTETLAVLATTGKLGSHACLILFAVGDDYKELYFATNRDTLKFENITLEPRVSLLLDNRSTRSSEDKGLALTLTGRASVLEGTQAESALSKLLTKNTVHGATVDAGKCAVIGIVLEAGRLVSTDSEQLFYDFD